MSSPLALVVEDDPDQANVVSLFMGRLGYQTRLAATGAEGVELARSLRPDLLLLDVMLPDTTGFSVCRDLRSEPATLLTPIVMISALNDSANRTKGIRVGANAYLGKPYGFDELAGAIDAARAWRSKMEQVSLQGEILVEFNSEVAFLQEVNDFLMNLTMAFPRAESNIYALRQVVMEMGQNAIEWGNQHRSEDLVTITYRIFDDRVEVIILDQGKGFDPENLAHAASPEDPIGHMEVREKLGLREGGFGLLVTKGMVDDIRYNDRGNEVTLVKRFQADEVNRR